MKKPQRPTSLDSQTVCLTSLCSPTTDLPHSAIACLRRRCLAKSKAHRERVNTPMRPATIAITGAHHWRSFSAGIPHKPGSMLIQKRPCTLSGSRTALNRKDLICAICLGRCVEGEDKPMWLTGLCAAKTVAWTPPQREDIHYLLQKLRNSQEDERDRAISLAKFLEHRSQH